MTAASQRQSKPDPAVSWTFVTDAPLRGMALAREAEILLAWDEGDQLQLIDGSGNRLVDARAAGKILSASISDDGSLVAVLVEGPRLCLLGRELEPILDKPAIPEAASLAVETLGRYVVVGSKLNQNQIYNKHGRPSGKFETTRPLTYLGFVPGKPVLICGSTNGWMTAVELGPSGRGSSLSCEPLWSHQLLSNLGRLGFTGDGGIILASCFNHGVQRYDFQGQNEGAYHLGGTASHAVPDFAGRSIVVATQEGEIALLNQGGNVRWKTALPRPAIALEMDALGRYFLFGISTGEIRRVDLDPSQRPPAAVKSSKSATSASSKSKPGPFREPAWSGTVAQTTEQAETAVLCVLDDPPRIGVITNENKLQVVSAEGELLGEGPQIIGVGRVLATSPGWIAASTDRMAALYDVRRDASVRLDLMMHDMTHMAIRPDTYGLAFVQERDRVGRVTPAARWVWKRELDNPVESLAINADGLTALSLDDGRIVIFDPAGEPAGRYKAEPSEPLILIEAPRGSPEGVEWVSLARRSQVLRGHRGDGKVAWETPVPWESWQLHRVGPRAVVTAPDGRALACDGNGNPGA